ncbi:Postmeiotic Segregation Increased 2-Like Protein 3-Like [Manis pentadactyla]|nr:Postmeiotic Segregation Increased 2-Like Protein 3-Like [Manis pentadactyla]
MLEPGEEPWGAEGESPCQNHPVQHLESSQVKLLLAAKLKRENNKLSISANNKLYQDSIKLKIHNVSQNAIC